ncbi:MAG: bifunctional DNA-formamidopyrimidine glycosylase/DNA-(apurinic or apyrimidinic site) lyase [Myxococcales bacterium]|nr:bifunctional DNA-formamidopyrimidine glycosylase/DNA-(apurinic or apyrimidinic site) lyase [Myxococcales bacterium]
MPELPEVEVTRRAVLPLLVGRRVTRVVTTEKSYFFLTPPATLRKRLVGRSVVSLDRHGKYLVARLDDASSLLLHLGMTGQLFSSAALSPRLLSAEARGALTRQAQRRFAADEHTHMVLGFSDRGPEVMFRDVRKFGKVRWLAPGKLDPRLEKLGVDALEVTGEQLFDASRRRRVPIKSLLLDQSVLAGVGNIYADEALFLAGVRPTRPARALRRAESDALAAAVVRVLESGIEAGGSSIDDFVRPDGTDGGYQREHRAYGRAGQPCTRCGTPMKRKVIGQRASCFCPGCQR